MKKLSFIQKILYSINVFFIVGLLFSFILPYLPPEKFGYFSLLSLVVPILLFGTVLLLFYWVFTKRRKLLYLNIFVLSLSYFFTPSLYKLKGTFKESQNELSIMTYNVRKFNKYKWIKEKDISTQIDAFIEKEDPDVLVMQEFKEDKNFNVKYPYHYRNQKKSYFSGLAFFSKYPIVKTGSVNFRGVFPSISFIDLVKKMDTVRIYNFHLQSLGVIPDKDYFGHKDSEKLLKRLNQSFKIQQKEIDTLNDHVKNTRHKVIIAGDMNNTAYSWAYKNLKKDRQDSFLEAGHGFGSSYNFKGFPLRIDYIFVDKSITINSHKNYTVEYSDHYPIMTTLSF